MFLNRAYLALAFALAIAGSAPAQTILKENFENLRSFQPASHFSNMGSRAQASLAIRDDCGDKRGSCMTVAFSISGPEAGGSADQSVTLWSFPAEALVGKTLRLRGKARKLGGGTGDVRVWLRTEGQTPWPAENNGKARQSAAADQWTSIQLMREVEENYKLVSVGVDSRGGIRGIELDDVELDTVPSSFIPPPPAVAADKVKVDELRRKAIPISSIHPEQEDFKDLQKLKRSIGNSRIVILGEQSHGDGSTFLAKQRLIRFLHKEMGFDVLAWESGFFTVEEMNKAIQSGVDPQECLRLGLISVWGESPLLIPLVQYAQQTHKSSKPLHMTGLDSAFLGKARMDFVPKIKSFLSHTPLVEHNSDGIRTMTEVLAALDPRNPTPYRPIKTQQQTTRQRIQDLIQALQSSVIPVKQKREAILLTKALEDLLDYEQLRTQGLNRSGTMGKSLAWIVNQWYPGHKVIVWCHNTHASRDRFLNRPASDDAEVARVQRLELGTLAEAAERELGPVVYSMYFTAHHGKWSTVHSAAS